MVSAYPLDEKLNLGLDLQGGIHLVLQVETEDAVRSETTKDMDGLVQELRKDGMTARGRQPDLEHGLRGHRRAGRPRGRDRARSSPTILPGWDWQRRGERAGCSTMKPQNVSEIRNLAVKQALETIRNRVDAFGVAEPVIQRQGLEGTIGIVVQLPGVDDPERVKRLIKNTAFLEFRLVDYPPGGGGVASREEIVAHYGGPLPDDLEIMTGPMQRRDGEDGRARSTTRSSARPVITGRDLKTARPGLGAVQPADGQLLPDPRGRQDLRRGDRRQRRQGAGDHPRRQRGHGAQHQEPDRRHRA